MFLRNIPLLCSLYFLNAQVALPTFQAIHNSQNSSSSYGPYTFTNCGATGRNGPSQSDCNSEYSGTNLDGIVTVSSGIQTWTVPSSGAYTIEVWGADGGDGDSRHSHHSLGGNGRKLKANYTLAQGSALKILVGQSGSTGTSWWYAGGGGGGTYICYSDNTPIVIASGGNGGSWGYWNVNGPDGLFSNSGNTNGGSANGRAGGGGGLISNGTQYSSYSDSKGISFTNGGTGGLKISSGSGVSGDGGFGGGGGSLYEGGGGGGYSGGTVVNTNQYNNQYSNYGAGSFTADNASSIVDIGTNNGAGKVIITKN